MSTIEPVLTLADIGWPHLERLLTRLGLGLELHAPGAPIPGSYWGEPEAGLIGNVIHARTDTPVHSILHEGCHYLCMPPQRRAGLHTNAGGDYAEENGVCFLQILFADEIPEMGRKRMCQDMDAWGYTFRLGSARAWFEHDAQDAKSDLRRWGLINAQGKANFSMRRVA